jgi:4-hydroxyproline epimerase
MENVPAFRHAANVAVDVDGIGKVVGDVAWGGNWFFLVHRHSERLELDNVERLTDYTWRIRQALDQQRITGSQGGTIDHIELFGVPSRTDYHSRNFVLCPGRSYDRSPCGTGTSAKLACLVSDGALREGQVWKQESIVGSVFEGSVRIDNGLIVPRIKGTAYVTAEATLLLHPEDPFCWGIRR